MENDIRQELFDGEFEREIHVVTYEGRIEAISYAKSPDIKVPEVKAIVSNPEGLVANQTTIVKGAGSALLDHTLQRYKVLGVEKVQLLATNDKYYIDRGWKAESESNECPTM